MKKESFVLLPREKTKKFGISSLSDEELLALLLGTGTLGVPIVEYSARLLHRKGGLCSLFSPEQSYDGIPGLGEAKRCRLLAVKEILRRLPLAEKERILCAKDAFEATAGIFFGKREEGLVVLYLAKDQSVIDKEEFTDCREELVRFPLRAILRRAVKNGCSFVIFLHNHPSGNLSPSPSDIFVTRRAKEKLLLAGVVLLDSMIVSTTGYHSMKEERNPPFSC